MFGRWGRVLKYEMSMLGAGQISVASVVHLQLYEVSFVCTKCVLSVYTSSW